MTISKLEQYTAGLSESNKQLENSKTGKIVFTGSPSATLRRAKIVSYQESTDTYTVNLIDSSSSTGTELSPCYVWGSSNFEVDDAVFIFIENQILYIFSSSGSGGSLVNHDHSSINSGGLVGWLS